MTQRLLRKWLPRGMAVIAGLLTLIGIDVLVEWAVVLAAFALVLGLFNVALVHWRRVRRSRNVLTKVCSLILLLFIVVGMAPPIIEPFEKTELLSLPVDARTLNDMVFAYILSPIGASLAALLAFSLAMAAFRILRNRQGGDLLLGWAFAATVVIVLLGTTPPLGLPVDLSGLAQLKAAVVSGPGTAGMRGILLGVGIGTIITAFRVLTGFDHPQSDE